jgi:hypothetical protein
MGYGKVIFTIALVASCLSVSVAQAAGECSCKEVAPYDRDLTAQVSLVCGNKGAVETFHMFDDNKIATGYDTLKDMKLACEAVRSVINR